MNKQWQPINGTPLSKVYNWNKLRQPQTLLYIHFYWTIEGVSRQCTGFTTVCGTTNLFIPVVSGSKRFQPARMRHIKSPCIEPIIKFSFYFFARWMTIRYRNWYLYDRVIGYFRFYVHLLLERSSVKIFEHVMFIEYL